jgi:hypothetical protein
VTARMVECAVDGRTGLVGVGGARWCGRKYVDVDIVGGVVVVGNEARARGRGRQARPHDATGSDWQWGEGERSRLLRLLACAVRLLRTCCVALSRFRQKRFRTIAPDILRPCCSTRLTLTFAQSSQFQRFWLRSVHESQRFADAMVPRWYRYVIVLFRGGCLNRGFLIYDVVT